MERGVISTHYRGQGEQTSCKRISASRAIPSLYPQPSSPPPSPPFCQASFLFSGSSHPPLPSSHGEIKWWNASGEGDEKGVNASSPVFFSSHSYFPPSLSLASPFFSRWNAREGASLFFTRHPELIWSRFREGRGDTLWIKVTCFRLVSTRNTIVNGLHQRQPTQFHHHLSIADLWSSPHQWIFFFWLRFKKETEGINRADRFTCLDTIYATSSRRTGTKKKLKPTPRRVMLSGTMT